MKRKYFKTFIIILTGIFAGITCLSADNSVFQTKCSKCHALRNPENYSKSEWKYHVERMAERAGLTPRETEFIIKLKTK